MKYYFYIENDKIIGKGQAKCLNLTCVEVLKEAYDDYEQDKYIYKDGEVILNPDYEEIKAQQELEQKAKDFFYTSLGYVRRKVTMTTGELRDFLFDIKPTLQIGIPIITYNEDGTQNRDVLVTEEFLKECDKQIYFDFYGSYPEVQ